MDDYKRIDELMKDEAFLEKIGDLTDPKDLAKAFTEAGVVVSAEQIENALVEAKKINIKDGEISESDLVNVSGGVPYAVGIAIRIGGVIALASFLRGVRAGTKCR